MSQWAAILIALAALAFTIISFWWMHRRIGSLVVTTPTTYAATSQAGNLTLLIPLVILNTGPVPHVVNSLRLRFTDEPTGVPLDFQLIRSGISPSHHPEPLDLAAAFPVPGNEVVRLFCEFIRKPGGRAMGAGTHPLVLEALTDKQPRWHTLLEFTLKVEDAAAKQMSRTFVAYANRLTEYPHGQTGGPLRQVRPRG
jgi:hypothetical protein